jgi:hypothetical protein
MNKQNLYKHDVSVAEFIAEKTWFINRFHHAFTYPIGRQNYTPRI